MYKRIFTLEALRYKDICKVYFYGTNIINTGSIGIGKVNFTKVISGPNGNYEISHNYYMKNFSEQMDYYNYDINYNNHRYFSDFSDLMVNFKNVDGSSKISTNNNYFVYLSSKVQYLDVKNKPPIYAKIGEILDTQPIVVVLDNTRSPIQGKIVMAFSWYSHRIIGF